jgi:hypothetical protein
MDFEVAQKTMNKEVIFFFIAILRVSNYTPYLGQASVCARVSFAWLTLLLERLSFARDTWESRI